jgi:16S rRNA processing protein RimM
VVGLEVRDEGKQVLGRVREILETGANDVFVVTPDGGGGLKNEMLIPALKDVVLKIDLGTGQMVVRPPRAWDR